MPRNPRVFAAGLLLALLALGAACSDDEEPNEVTVEGSELAFAIAEGELTPGINTITFRNRGAIEHHMQIFRLDPGRTTQELVEAFSDPAAPPPTWALPMGGVGILSTGLDAAVTVDLREGDYVLICFLGEEEGAPHFLRGMAVALTVEGAEVKADAPEEDVTIIGIDFKFDVPETVDAGEVTIRFNNLGQTAHEMILAAVPEGSTVSDEELVAFFAAGDEAPPPFEPFPPPLLGGCRRSSPERASSPP